jgi:hypothetical protein|nr:MAG TPA: hypothetical protein [Caudoviricetes sp.]
MKATIKLSSIKIPKSYAVTTPSEKKVRTKRKKYRKGKLRAITINTDGFLINGYISYLILKENNVEDAEVNIVDIKKNDNSNVPESYRNTRTTYIYGKHPNNKSEKIYTWRIPNAESWRKFSKMVLPDDLIFCKTKFGCSPVIVQAIQTVDKCPVEFPVKKVLSKKIIRNGKGLE